MKELINVTITDKDGKVITKWENASAVLLSLSVDDSYTGIIHGEGDELIKMSALLTKELLVKVSKVLTEEEALN